MGVEIISFDIATVNDRFGPSLDYDNRSQQPPNHKVRLKPRSPRQQLPQHIRQNPAMQVVINLNRRIDSEGEWYFLS